MIGEQIFADRVTGRRRGKGSPVTSKTLHSFSSPLLAGKTVRGSVHEPVRLSRGANAGTPKWINRRRRERAYRQRDQPLPEVVIAGR
jgi:hypothetical protein